jgi:hypothetical protein
MLFWVAALILIATEVFGLAVGRWYWSHAYELRADAHVAVTLVEYRILYGELKKRLLAILAVCSTIYAVLVGICVVVLGIGSQQDKADLPFIIEIVMLTFVVTVGPPTSMFFLLERSALRQRLNRHGP